MASKPINDPHPYEQHILTLALILVSALLVYSHVAKRLDLLTYDAFTHAATVDPDPNIVIISIDEKSLNSIGQWPWRRAIHAQLVDKLRYYQASLIVFDVLFSEYDTQHPADDFLLAEAIEDAGNVLLPLHVHPLAYDKPLSEILPIPELANAALGLGHVHVELDEDGLTRGIFLNTGVGDAYWPAMSMAMAVETNPMVQYLQEIRQQTRVPYVAVNAEYRLIPFAGPRGTYPTYSYVDVMSNKIPAETFRNKTILIGATAAGLGDIIPTPFSHMNSPMSGVEIHANAYSAIINQNIIRSVSERWVYLLTFAFILVPILIFPRIRPTFVMPSTMLLAAGIFGFSYALLVLDRTWFPPVNSVLGVLIAYPLWSWQRMRHLNSFFSNELERLSREPDLSFRRLSQHSLEKIFLALIAIIKPKAYVFTHNGNVIHGLNPHQLSSYRILEEGVWQHDESSSWIKLTIGDDKYRIGLAIPSAGFRRPITEFLNKLELQSGQEAIIKKPSEQIAKRIHQVRDAITAMQDMRTFISRGFEEMPGAVIVTDPIGLIVYANSRALSWLQAEKKQIISTPIYELFAALKADNDDFNQAISTCLLEGKGKQFNLSIGHRDVMIHCLPFLVDEHSDAGLMISMSDITEIRQQQREKNQLIDFLSHDVRSPLSSQLALLQGLRSGRIEFDSSVIDQLASHAERSLSLSDQFLQITRAEQAIEEDFYEFELVNAIENAIDSISQLARQKNIDITLSGDEEIWLFGSAELIERSLINLLSNATKYSDESKPINVDVQQKDTLAVITIEDQGFGIKADELPRIFERFRRQQVSEKSGPKGAGLGLNFVKVVVEKHKGDISVDSVYGVGSAFTIRLPILSDQ
ncbi:MAG: CHASE2 domain-containing protein [Oleiphilaceae bacterium]|nr:CHASE2 domain-containing protein [Oleiphilaceae bacterium]